MATATSTAPTADGAGENQPRGGHRGRGRGRGQRSGERGGYPGISNDRGEDRTAVDTGRGRGGRVRGRGRGGRGGRGNRDRAASNSQQDSAALQPPPQPGGNGVFGARLTKDAEEKNTQQGEKNEGADVAGDDVEAEVCFICASSVAHQSVAPCNHRTCHICALRLRALYKTKACAHCRTEAATVIFTDDPEKRYEDYDASKDFFREDKNLGICYEKPEIFEDTVILLRYNCPEDDCDSACLGWPDLHRHVRSVHSKWMCDLCTRNKKVFTHEHELFTKQELQRHEKFGDDKPGAINQSGFKGHPECGFCRQRFYGDDELFAHCRDRHERCHLCDRRTGGNNPQYYLNYEALEQHFGKEHYPCLDSECLEKKFVVFDSEMDLKAHQLENHPNGLSKDARRDARRVDISAFNYRPQYEEPRRGGRRGGRGRDPNAEPTPASSGGHMSRAELAHQREREIHSAQSVTARSFGGSLSQPDPTPAQVQRPAPSPRPANAQPVAPPTAPQSPRPAPALTPADQARQLRHNAVTERASNLLRNDKVKLDEFRERISSYTKGAISAGDLIDAFFALFDTASDQLGKLIKELADIFEIPAKREGLLKAWSDWKAINEDYPSLPAPAGANATAAGVLGSGLGSSRVLKLKSSTAQSSRSGVARRYNSAAASNSANQFPSLPPRHGGPAPKGPAPLAPTPSWLAAHPPTSTPTSLSITPSGSARASPAPSRAQSTANLSGANAFPALPVAKKPTSTVFSPGYTGRGVIRADSNYTGANAWTPGGAANGSGPTGPPPEDENVTRKGKKGKQIVFKWG